jgi:hypothetical protein
MVLEQTAKRGQFQRFLKLCDFSTTKESCPARRKEGRQDGWSAWEVMDKRLVAEQAGDGQHGGKRRNAEEARTA